MGCWFGTGEGRGWSISGALGGLLRRLVFERRTGQALNPDSEFDFVFRYPIIVQRTTQANSRPKCCKRIQSKLFDRAMKYQGYEIRLTNMFRSTLMMSARCMTLHDIKDKKRPNKGQVGCGHSVRFRQPQLVTVGSSYPERLLVSIVSAIKPIMQVVNLARVCRR